MPESVLEFLEGGDHLHDNQKKVFKACEQLAHEMNTFLRDGAEKSAGLRKLLEAKDCFVRQSLRDDKNPLSQIGPAGQQTA